MCGRCLVVCSVQVQELTAWGVWEGLCQVCYSVLPFEHLQSVNRESTASRAARLTLLC